MRYGVESYTRLNPDEITDPKRRRRVRWFARVWHATPTWADTKKMRAIYAEARRRRDLGEDVVVDHCVQLFHELVCGLHNEFNLQILTAVENSEKSNNSWADMPGGVNRVVQLGLFEPDQYALPLHE